LSARGELGAKDTTAALLAGDFYPNADEGDVRSVWLAMDRTCRWVAGVAGNHDVFGPGTSNRAARNALEPDNMHFLDEKVVKVDGLLVGGLSGIVSQKGDCWHRSADDFASAMARLADQGVDVLL